MARPPSRQLPLAHSPGGGAVGLRNGDQRCEHASRPLSHTAQGMLRAGALLILFGDACYRPPTAASPSGLRKEIPTVFPTGLRTRPIQGAKATPKETSPHVRSRARDRLPGLSG
jgi:hypothetical protein